MESNIYVYVCNINAGEEKSIQDTSLNIWKEETTVIHRRRYDDNSTDIRRGERIGCIQ
jgi:hypothetical protein